MSKRRRIWGGEVCNGKR